MNIVFMDNSASHAGGGGMYNQASSPILINVVFHDNSANGGGGMMNISHSNPTLTNVTFSGNSAMAGGGIFNLESSPLLTNVTFSGNRATAAGAGMRNVDNSNPTLTNVTFSNNRADFNGSAMSNRNDSNPQIYSTIFWGNTDSTETQIFNENSTPILSDSVVQGGCPVGSTCTNIITGDPMLGALGSHSGFAQTIPLLANSSAVDIGTNVDCPATDQRGVTRPQGSACDIGAFELDDFKIQVGALSISCQKPDFFTIKAEITSNGPGIVGYGWIPGGWQPPAKETLKFDQAATQTITQDFPFSINNPDANDPSLDWVMLQIFQPEGLLTDKIPRKCP